MKKRSRYKNPNVLNTDQRLDYTARNVGRVFYAFRNALGQCKKSYAELARLANCSPTTAVKAVQQLIDAGYITRSHTSYYSDKLGRVITGKNCYDVNLKVLESGYTLIGRDSFNLGLSDFAAVLYAQVLTEAGNTNRAFPSISRIQRTTGATRSTVCAGLKLLKKLSSLLVQLCKKRNGAYSSNSYILIKECSAMAPTPSVSVQEAADRRAVDLFRDFYFTIKSCVCKAVKRLFAFLAGNG